MCAASDYTLGMFKTLSDKSEYQFSNVNGYASDTRDIAQYVVIRIFITPISENRITITSIKSRSMSRNHLNRAKDIFNTTNFPFFLN